MSSKIVFKAPLDYVYLLQSRKREERYKIGFSSDLVRRINELNMEMEDLDWRLVAAFPSKNPRRVEKAFHNLFASRRIKPGKEWFMLEPAEVELFRALSSEVEWPKVMRHLLDQRDVLTAAVFNSASALVFEGDVLRVTFPASSSFHVGQARDSFHAERLKDAVEAVFGKRPAEVRAASRPLEAT